MTIPLQFLLIASSATSASPPPHQQRLPGIFEAGEYPRSAIAREEQGQVYLEVLVNPEGRVDKCTIIQSSGFKDLDEATCGAMTARAVFSPARDESNSPIYATFRQQVTWRLNDKFSPPPIEPDWDFTINQAPQGVKLPLQFAVEYFVRANGTARDCHFAEKWIPMPRAKPPQEMVDLACSAVMKSSAPIVRNQKNEPVEALDGTTVRFSLKP